MEKKMETTIRGSMRTTVRFLFLAGTTGSKIMEFPVTKTLNPNP